MPAENVLTPDFLRQLAWEPPIPINSQTIGQKLLDLGARQWQVEQCAARFAEALVGLSET